MGHVIRLRPEVDEYKRIHAAVWPEVPALTSTCNSANCTIFLEEPENLMFAYREYHGANSAADMAVMRADSRMQGWWRITRPDGRRRSTTAPEASGGRACSGLSSWIDNS